MATKKKATKKKETTPSMPIPQNMLVILGIGLVLGFVLGHLWTRVDLLEKGGSAGTGGTAEQGVAAPEEPRELSIAAPDPDEDHWFGPTDARYVHVEYSDFECPFCGAYLPTLNQLKDEYGDQMAFVYRHFPLSFHPLAQPAAEASECVAEQGGNEAFWAFHDLMFEAMPDITVEEFGGLAVQAGVDGPTFTQCLDDGTFTQKVQDQFNEGSSAGVAATPTSVIYDMETGETALIEGALPFDQVKTIVDGFIQ